MDNIQNCQEQAGDGLRTSSHVLTDQVQIVKPAARGTAAGNVLEVNRGHSMLNDSTRDGIGKGNVASNDCSENYLGGWAGYFDACENKDLKAAFNAMVSLGMRPVPLGPDDKGKIKIPIGKGWGKTPIDERRKLLANNLKKQREKTGIGCQPFGYVVFDLDPPDKDPARIQETKDDFLDVMLAGEIIETLEVKGERGVHFWFKADDEFLKQWGDKKRLFSTPSGGHVEVFIGSEENQMQVACAPSRGKQILHKIPPCTMPDPLKQFLIDEIQAEPKQGNAERRHEPAPDGSTEEKQFLELMPRILHEIKIAPGGKLHYTLRKRVRTIAGYAAGLGCERYAEKVFEVATENLDINGGCENYRKAEKTMQWAWINGIKSPLRPDEKSHELTEAAKPAFAPSELMRKQSELDRKPPLQLIPGFMEMNQCQLVGFMGAGKGAISSLIAAHITTGRTWWTGDACLPGSVLMFSAEDSTAVMEYRCKAAGANVYYGPDDSNRNCVICFGSGHEALMGLNGLPLDLTDTGWLDQWRETLPDLKAIIIDPIKGLCGQRGPSQSEEEHVRAKMSKTLTWASNNRIAVICAIQPAKGSRTRHIDEMASGSMAWASVTRSIVCLEENVHYGQGARVLLAGRQSNGVKGKPTIFDIEAVHARDRYDEPVYTPEDGKPVTVPVLRYREQIEHQDYIVPPDERATPEKSSPKRILDHNAIRIAACETISSNGGAMSGMPSNDLLKDLRDPQEDDRWLGYVCGHLARRFKAAPRTIKNILYNVFTSNMETRIKVPGWICGSKKQGFDDGWVWTAEKDPTVKQSVDSPPF